MLKATFRFYEELNEFLPTHRKKTDFEAAFKEKRSIKDMLESMGVPHTEIDLILVNGISVDFAYTLQNNDRVSVYPTFEALNIENLTRLRKIPLRRNRFIADINLGDIVKYMRALGFDIFYDTAFTNRDIIALSNKENRIILSKNKKLLKFKDVSHGIYLYPGTTAEQIRRVIDRLDIKNEIKLFSRCLRCNALLVPVAKEAVLDRIPPKTRQFCHAYTRCLACDKLYWRGTHLIHMEKVLKRIIGDLS
ncbi:MAG: Mut7-C ubiquitin/RNAse domain-containing protein [Deltaproteobacteria bacterium]|nr:Mut7-C ubiquitin/RNAse domain-containing protein [Deltaproteobacteria bacterium]